MTSHLVDVYLEENPPEPSPQLTEEMATAFDGLDDWWELQERRALEELQQPADES